MSKSLSSVPMALLLLDSSLLARLSSVAHVTFFLFLLSVSSDFLFLLLVSLFPGKKKQQPTTHNVTYIWVNYLVHVIHIHMSIFISYQKTHSTSLPSEHLFVSSLPSEHQFSTYLPSEHQFSTSLPS